MTSQNGLAKLAAPSTLLQYSRSGHVCRKCSHLISNTAPQSNRPLPVSLITRRHTGSRSFTDRLRSKLFKDTPPGGENPYGAPGSFEQRRREQEMRKELDKTSTAQKPSRKGTNPPTERFGDVPEESAATTWEGMPMVGGPDWGLEEWDEQHPFEGFMAGQRVETREEMVSIVHRALVEIMTLKEANLPLEIAKEANNPSEEYKRIIAEQAKFNQSGETQLEVVFGRDDLREAILEYIHPPEPIPEENASQELIMEDDQPQEDLKQEDLQTASASNGDESTSEQGETSAANVQDVEAMVSEETTPEEHSIEETTDSEIYAPSDDSWRQVQLTDPAFKFALKKVLKRVMQLTGRRLSDPDIQSIYDSRTLLTHLVKKPKPKKLAETLFTREELDLPNVEIRDRRYTPIDKEKEIGRWKVIERELQLRGLPVTGKGLTTVGDPVA
ncbi:hypothetical protein ACLMJK_004643 [Lecanora helva]